MFISNPGRRLLLLLLFLAGFAVPALAVDFNAYWDYRARGGDNMETTDQFQQRYSLGVGPGISYQLTPAISASANLSYTRTQRDVGEGMTTVEELRPSAQINLTNDIFIASLSGMITEYYPDRGDKFTTNSWDASLASNWQRDFWPTLYLNYGESTETFPGAFDADGVENEDKTYSLGLNWDLRLASLFYDYSVLESDNLANDSREERQNHLARIETGQSFWNKRISYTLAQQYQQSDGDLFLFSEDSFAEVPLPFTRIQHLVTDSGLPLPNDPDFDDNLTTGLPPLVEDGSALYLVGEFGFDEQVDRLDLTINPLEVTGSQVASLPWRLYLWNGGAWVLTTTNLAAVYNPARERVELSLDLAEPVDRIMVSTFVDLPDGLEIVRLEALSLIRDDTTSRQTSHLTNASLRVQLTPTLSASSSLVMEILDSENASEFSASESELPRRNLTAGLRWTPSPFVTPSISYSETREDGSNESLAFSKIEAGEVIGSDSQSLDELSRRYSLVIATYPLPTLNVTFGATRTERFSDGRQISMRQTSESARQERFTDGRQTFTSDGFSINTTASIYPDLTASLDVNYLVSERNNREEISARDNQEEVFDWQSTRQEVSSDVLTTRLTLNARLTPSLIADLTINYRDNESETITRTITGEKDPDTGAIVIPETELPKIDQRTSSTSAVDSVLSLLYRPSPLLSMRLTETRYWSGVDSPDLLSFNLDLALLRTRNTRLNFIYNHSEGLRTSDRFALNGSWDISRNLSLRTDLAYRIAEVDTWNIFAALTLRL